MAGEHDDFIHKRHSEAIHARFAGDKSLIVVEGDHNSPRPKFMFDSAGLFLRQCLQIPPHLPLYVPSGLNLRAPPWFYPGRGGGGISVGLHLTGRAHPLPPHLMGTGIMPAAVARRRAHCMSGGGDGKARAPTPPQQRRGSHQTAAAAVGASRGDKSGGGFDPEEIGMTGERQREIQASLFKMLGQSDRPAWKKGSERKPRKEKAGGGGGTGMGPSISCRAESQKRETEPPDDPCGAEMGVEVATLPCRTLSMSMLTPRQEINDSVVAAREAAPAEKNADPVMMMRASSPPTRPDPLEAVIGCRVSVESPVSSPYRFTLKTPVEGEGGSWEVSE